MSKEEERRRSINAVYLLLRKGDTILLARRRNTGYQDGNYDLPAGHVDTSEVPTQALIREMKEELGIILRAEDLHFSHVCFTPEQPGMGGDRVDFFFEATTWECEPRIMEPHKCDSHIWVTFDTVPENISPRTKQVLKNIQSGKTFSEHQKY